MEDISKAIIAIVMSGVIILLGINMYSPIAVQTCIGTGPRTAGANYNLPFDNPSGDFTSKTMNQIDGTDVVVERFSTGATAIGKEIDKIQFWIYDSGSNHTGTVVVQVYDSSNALVKTLGSISVSALDNSFDPDVSHTITFDPYVIETGDQITFSLTGGNPSNSITEIMLATGVPIANAMSEIGPDVGSTDPTFGGDDSIAMVMTGQGVSSNESFQKSCDTAVSSTYLAMQILPYGLIISGVMLFVGNKSGYV